MLVIDQLFLNQLLENQFHRFALFFLIFTINIGVIVYRIVEQWRHKRAVDLSRKMVSESIKDLDQIEADKKAARQKIRDEFIRKRMMEASPLPAKGKNAGKKNKVADSQQTPAPGKKVAPKHMNTIAEIDENGEITDRKTHAMAAPSNPVNAIAHSSMQEQSVDQMIHNPRFGNVDQSEL